MIGIADVGDAYAGIEQALVSSRARSDLEVLGRRVNAEARTARTEMGAPEKSSTVTEIGQDAVPHCVAALSNVAVISSRYIKCGDPVQRLSVSSELTAMMSRTLLLVKFTYCFNLMP